MSSNSESCIEYEAKLNKMIQTGKLKPEYKSLLLEITELGDKAYSNGLILGLGWGEDGNNTTLDEYEIMDTSSNLLYLTLSETRDYLQNLIEYLG
ncbi:hypothetical protein [Nostoc sp.]|uniref:hypothetical protein n=1 Tax=Nostoc sp. TaxID=1180 RepID=UPI002FF91AB3